MKKIMTMTAVMMAAMVLVGCPAVQVPAPNNGDGNVPIEMGSLHIEGDLYGRDGEKILSHANLIEIGETFKAKARSINIYLYEKFEYGTYGANHQYNFSFPVVDGHFEGTAEGIFPATYEGWININDERGYSLFVNREASEVVIEAGQISEMAVTVDFLRSYIFYVVINNLPGSYGEWGEAMLLSRDGNQYPIYWYNYGPEPRTFNAWVPLDFEGGAISITDQNGTTYLADLPLVVADLDWYSYNFGDLLVYDYAEPDWLGGLDVSITFGWEDNYYVRVGDPESGTEYESIQQAIEQESGESLSLYLGAGDYDGFIMPLYRSVAIFGQGADLTRIVDTDPNRPHVIYASYWAWPQDAVQVKEQSEWTRQSVGEKGGGWSLQLADLTVYNGPDKRNEYYSDAAVFVEAGIYLVLDNVVVASESNTCVATNYANGVYISHCDLIGPLYFSVSVSGDPKGIAAYNEQNVYVDNSIIGWVGPAVYCSNGDVDLEYDCFYSYVKLAWAERYPYWEPDVSTSIFADPLIGENWRLLPDSPCLGTASDGLDIGVAFAVE